MPWNPLKYNEFKKERYQPFFDLIEHIEDLPNLSVLDLGCGTGELTQILTDKLTNATVLGIDNSPEMLTDAPKGIAHLSFEEKSIEVLLAEPIKYDVIIANAALQWVDNHQELIPSIIAHLNPNGQLAIQMPSQTENLLNKILYELVQEDPFALALKGWKRTSPVLSMDEYTTILFYHQAKEMTIYQKVYPIIADSYDKLYNFILGSSLVPYFERLDEAHKALLEKEFKARIAKHYLTLPAIYAFKRMIIWARV